MSTDHKNHKPQPQSKSASRFKINPIEIGILAGFIGSFGFLFTHFAKEYDGLQLSAYQSTPLRGNLTYNERTLGRVPSSVKREPSTSNKPACERNDHVCLKKMKF